MHLCSRENRMKHSPRFPLCHRRQLLQHNIRRASLATMSNTQARASRATTLACPMMSCCCSDCGSDYGSGSALSHAVSLRCEGRGGPCEAGRGGAAARAVRCDASRCSKQQQCAWFVRCDARHNYTIFACIKMPHPFHCAVHIASRAASQPASQPRPPPAGLA